MRPRGLTHLTGASADTARAARRMVAPLADDDVLWVEGPSSAAALRRALGASFDAVVLDQHHGADADAIAAAAGFVRGGGRLVLRWATSPPPSPRLALPPYPPEAIGRHLAARLRAPDPAVEHPAHPLGPADRPTGGTIGQAAAIATLTDSWRRPSLVALVARRGRGKSTALGRALAQRPPGLRCALTAPHREAAQQVFTEAGDLPFLDPLDALEAELDVLAVDEAAQLPIPWLRQLVRRHPHATLWFATTTGGYEGTGQGFVHRFLATLDHDPRPLQRPVLTSPIRWAHDDPLERWLDRRLLMAPCAPPPPTGPMAPRHPSLATDPDALEQVFALLTHAHYRTTPSDLQRLLDAPNLRVHTLADDAGRVGAVNLVAEEGRLPPALCRRMASGAVRIRGHALADTLVCHAGHPEAGSWRMVRSVRIATHPDRRRRGWGHRLAEHVHDLRPAPDLFGTLFGATPALLRFRRAQGYRLVRLGASRGSRTGEPSAVMVRPCSPRAHRLVDELRQVLARDLPLQLALLHGDGELPLAADLVEALGAGLPDATPWTDEAAWAVAREYAHGPRPLEAAASALVHVLSALGTVGDTAQEVALVDARLRTHRSWAGLAREQDWPSVRAAMRAMRRVWQKALRP